MKRIFCLIIAICAVATICAQKQPDFRRWEDSLIQLRSKAIGAGTELERYQANEDFMILLEQVLNEPGSFIYPELMLNCCISSPL